jgi:hypothetical protein
LDGQKAARPNTASSGDDGRGGERDRFSDPGKRTHDRIVRRPAVAQLLSHPEDEEEAVVRARAERQDDQQDPGERRHLESGLARRADHRPGQLGDHHGGREREQRGQDRAEDDEHQREDEHDGQVLADVSGLTGAFGRVGLRGQRPGEVSGQIAGQPGGPDRTAQCAVERFQRALGGEVQSRKHLQLLDPAVAADAEVLDLLHGGDPAETGRQTGDGGAVRRGQRAAVAGDDDRHGRLIQALERGGQLGGLPTLAAGRTIIAGAALRDAVQRRKVQVGQDGRDNPGGDHRPAESDRDPPGGGEEPRHVPLSPSSTGLRRTHRRISTSNSGR